MFITPYQDHDLTNDGETRLRFVTIWWGGAEAVARERAKWASVFEIDDPSGPVNSRVVAGVSV